MAQRKATKATAKSIKSQVSSNLSQKKRATNKQSRKTTTPSPSLLTLFPEYRKKEYTTRVAENRVKFIRELKQAYLHRGLVLYLGAGVSRSIGLPTWPELIRSLTVTMMTRKVESAIDTLGGLTEEKRFQAILAIQENVQNEADYDKPILMMARAIKDEFGDKLSSQLARSLYRTVRGKVFYRRFDKHDLKPVRIAGSLLLDAIVALARAERDVMGVQAIVNYNFDDLVDEKLRQENVRCRTVLSGRDRVPPGTLPCYHVHGVLPYKDYIENRYFRENRKVEAKGNFVFSEDEYHAEYADAYKWSNMTQMSLLGRYTGLFVGLSMEDPNIRRLIDVTHRQYPEISNFAILARKKNLSRNPDSKQGLLRNLFEEVETASFAKIGVKVIWVDNYDEIPKVLMEVCDVETA
jgi:hypothetical protein